MDELDRLLWKKAVKMLEDREGSCCSRRYPPGHVLRSRGELRDAVEPCRASFVMFFGRTCPYCAAFDPIFRQVGARYGDYANFVKADVEAFPDLAASLGIMGTPTTVSFSGGRPMYVLPGFATAPQLRAFVESTLRAVGCR